VKAALYILKFKYSREKEDLEKAEPLFRESLNFYKALVDLTRDSYFYANSLQTGQRRIPVGGNNGRNKTWEELLPLYELEYQNFVKNLEDLDNSRAEVELHPRKWESAEYQLIEGGQLFTTNRNQSVFTGREDLILELAPELDGLTGIRFDYDELVTKPVKYILDLKEDASILMAYFNSNEPWYLMKPALETDAEADIRGAAEPVLRHAMTIQNHPGVNIHLVKYERGLHEIVPGQGCFFIAGIIKKDNQVIARDAFIGQDRGENLQWLFE
jgi:hypothetical protein